MVCCQVWGRQPRGVPFKSLCVQAPGLLCDIFIVTHFGISIFFLLWINGESRWYFKNEKSFLDKLISWPNFVGTSSFPTDIWSALDSKSLKTLTLRGFSTTGIFILKARMPHKFCSHKVGLCANDNALFQRQGGLEGWHDLSARAFEQTLDNY